MGDKFSRLVKMIGQDKLDIIKKKTVLVIGCGGVGGYVIESLVRSGIGRIIIVDYDVIEQSNINRQIIALDSTIGRKKVDALEERIKDINHEVEVIKIDMFIDDSNIDELFNNDIDYVVDACDTISTKLLIIKKSIEKNIKFISCMGTGNRLDPTKLGIVDIRKTNNDPLARVMRKLVKDNKINNRIPVLCSTELPIKVSDHTPGSSAFVPASAGLIISSHIIREIINEE